MFGNCHLLNCVNGWHLLISPNITDEIVSRFIEQFQNNWLFYSWNKLWYFFRNDVSMILDDDMAYTASSGWSTGGWKAEDIYDRGWILSESDTTPLIRIDMLNVYTILGLFLQKYDSELALKAIQSAVLVRWKWLPIHKSEHRSSILDRWRVDNILVWKRNWWTSREHWTESSIVPHT